MRRHAVDALEDPSAGGRVGPAERDLAQHGILRRGHLGLDQPEDDVLDVALATLRAAVVGVADVVEPVGLVAVEDRLLERDTDAADVHRAGTDLEVEASRRGERVAVIGGAGRPDDVEQLRPALLGEDEALLVLLGLEGHATLLRRDSGVVACGVVGQASYVGGHGLPLFVSASASNCGIGICTAVRPTGRNSSSLICSERSLIEAPCAQ